jgi:Leucine-rich repeat (LRR) protein
VSILQLIPNLEVLSLSANQISSLRHFAFCGQLKQLYLRANAVADLAELRYIMLLQDLRVLWLADNPCTKLPHYR